jgi:hypothetical protein
VKITSTTAPTTAPIPPQQSAGKQVWSEDEFKAELRRLDYQFSVVLKQHGDDNNYGGDDVKAKKVRTCINSANDNFILDNFSDLEKNLSEGKDNLIEIVNGLKFPWGWAYYISVWGIVPIYLASIEIFSCFLLLRYFSHSTIMGIVPLWALLVAAMGAGVQILVGVAKDYKDDGLITDYKRLWYAVLIPVSLAFGFVAFLLIQAGLFNLSQGQIALNQALNQTVTTTTITQIGANQTITQTTAQNGTVNNSALPIVICFLAGYATDWFMGMLGKLAPTK